MNNREIKFRVWDVSMKKMIPYNGYWCRFNDPSYICQQYTGLKDSKGMEIYEGDIIKDVVGDFNTAVFWDDKRGEWNAGHGTFRDSDFIPIVITDSPSCGRTKIVVGNVFENPELLK